MFYQCLDESVAYCLFCYIVLEYEQSGEASTPSVSVTELTVAPAGSFSVHVIRTDCVNEK